MVAAEIVEAQAQGHCAAGSVGVAHAAGHAVDQGGQGGVDLGERAGAAAQGALGADRAAAVAHPDPARIPIVGEVVQVAAVVRAEQADQGGLAQAGHVADRGDLVFAQLAGGHRADAPEALDRQRVQEVQLLAGPDLEQAVRFSHCTRDLRQELGAGDADGDRQADLVPDGQAELSRDVPGRAANFVQAGDVEEGLVDRDAFDQRGGVPEDVEHGAAGLGVRMHAGWNHDGAGAKRPGLTHSHRGADAARLGLITGREDHAHADQNRTTAQRGIVALLDRRVESVEIGVQDRHAPQPSTGVRRRPA
jgi:hypothetical protein